MVGGGGMWGGGRGRGGSGVNGENPRMESVCSPQGISVKNITFIPPAAGSIYKYEGVWIGGISRVSGDRLIPIINLYGVRGIGSCLRCHGTGSS